jgi:hypothetical protein
MHFLHPITASANFSSATIPSRLTILLLAFNDLFIFPALHALTQLELLFKKKRK